MQYFQTDVSAAALTEICAIPPLFADFVRDFPEREIVRDFFFARFLRIYGILALNCLHSLP
jgi:hypothetical protein